MSCGNKHVILDNNTREHKGPPLDGVDVVGAHVNNITPGLEYKGAGLHDSDGVYTQVPEIDQWQPGKGI